MANQVMNIAKGRINEYTSRVANNDGPNSAIVVVLLQTAQADADLIDYANLSLLLANAGNVEADFTNYTRLTLDDSVVPDPIPDNTNDVQNTILPDLTYTNAGGAVNNSIVKLIYCFDPDTTTGDDTTVIPQTHHDVVFTTDGTTRNVLNPADGPYGAQ